jgi:hypothetical protein
MVPEAKASPLKKYSLKSFLSDYHFLIVLGIVILSLFLVDYLVGYRDRNGMKDVRIQFGSIIFSMVLPFLLYWIMVYLTGRKTFGFLFFDFSIALALTIGLFPSLKGYECLFITAILLGFAACIAWLKWATAWRRQKGLPVRPKKEDGGRKEQAGDPAPDGAVPTVRRMREYVDANRPSRQSFMQVLVREAFSLLLIIGIEYIFILLMQSMSKSVDGRTKFATYLVTLALPVLVYWANDFVTARSRVGGLCVKCLLSMGILFLILSTDLVFKLLWFPFACFALGFLVSQVKEKKRKRRRVVVYSGAPQTSPEQEDDWEEDVYRRKSTSISAHCGWVNTFYSWFRMKKY